MSHSKIEQEYRFTWDINGCCFHWDDEGTEGEEELSHKIRLAFERKPTLEVPNKRRLYHQSLLVRRWAMAAYYLCQRFAMVLHWSIRSLRDWVLSQYEQRFDTFDHACLELDATGEKMRLSHHFPIGPLKVIRFHGTNQWGYPTTTLAPTPCRPYYTTQGIHHQRNILARDRISSGLQTYDKDIDSFTHIILCMTIILSTTSR